MSALIVLITALLLYIVGVIAGYMLWGAGWGTLVWIGLTALFHQQIIMTLLLTVGFIFMGRANMTA